MVGKKKPDNVVFDTETQKYNAALKSYAKSVGASVITTKDTVASFPPLKRSKPFIW